MKIAKEGNMYFIPTPIGNLGDITLRSLETLKLVDEIYCEDTRHSIGLLTHFGIQKPLHSYHKFNEKKTAPIIIEKLKKGKKIGYISDAGMPCISDPGDYLVGQLLAEDLGFTVLPGASALTTAIAGANMKLPYSFIGFLPEGNTEKKKLLNDIKSYKGSLIFYSSRYDLNKNLNDLFTFLGKRKIMIANELTKLHEKRIYTVLDSDLEIESRGEYVLVVEGEIEHNDEFLEKSIREHFQYFLTLGYENKEAMKEVAKARNVKKSDIYKELNNDGKNSNK